ncbi:MAG: hypothetical protein FD158_3132 [bacterium]|nr:MAG: hypothetical protein FD158_3132 [bacterium]
MGQRRIRRTNEFKAQVALEAILGDRSLSELSSKHRVTPRLIAYWKQKLLDGAPSLFAHGGSGRTVQSITGPLYEEIGRLKMELDWLKKKL